VSKSRDADSEPIPRWQSQLRHDLASAPPTFEQSADAFRDAHQSFLEELARAVEPRLNESMRAMPKSTLEECRDLASWCNRQLSQLGLTIKSPDGAVPCALLAETRSGDPTKSPRFRFQARDTSNGVRVGFSRTLPTLSLMPAPPARAGFVSRGRHR